MVKRLEAGDSPEQLSKFYSDLNRNEISRETFTQHLHALESGYAAQEERLTSDNRPFLTGNTFSTADIIWAIKVLRLTECGYPFEKNFPALAAWYRRVEQRPGFQDGVLAKNRFFHTAFRFKARVERLLGVGIQTESQFAA